MRTIYILMTIFGATSAFAQYVPGSPQYYSQSGANAQAQQPQQEVRSTSYSKSYSDSPVSRVIPQLGLTIATVAGEKVKDADSTTRASAGATVDFGHSDFVLESGALYRQMGASASEGGETFTLTLDYLSIPLLAKYYVNGVSSSAAFFVKGGLQPGLLVRKKAELKSGSSSQSTNDISGISSTDIPVLVGAGGKFAAAQNMSIIVEGNYSRGLTKINTSGTGIYNSVVGLTAGLGYDF